MGCAFATRTELGGELSQEAVSLNAKLLLEKSSARCGSYPRSARCERGRAGGIRTHDLLNPIQAFYQAELRPDLRGVVSSS
jgi:hypothetical protein